MSQGRQIYEVKTIPQIIDSIEANVQYVHMHILQTRDIVV